MKKMLKKSLSVLLAAVMVFGIAPLNGFVGLNLPEFGGLKKIADSVSGFFEGFATKAEAVEVSGYYTYSVTYYGKASIEDVDESISGEITIPANLGGYPVVWIADNAFSNCDKITSVFISDGIEYIGENAFFNCTGLEKVEFGESELFDIGSYAFSNCTNLEKLVFSGSDFYIYEHVFEKCSSLKNVSLPENIICLGDCVFDKCTSLESVQIYNDELNLPGGAFRECSSLISVTIPENSEKIGGWAFEKCTSLKEIIIPDSIKTIDQYAFLDCTNLETVSIGTGVTVVGVGAFSGCTSLEKISIPDNVTGIGGYAFAGCTNLKTVNINSDLKSIKGYLFSNCIKLESILIPDSVTTIYTHAFDNCSSLKDIVISDNVTVIEDFAFSGCSNLTDVTIPNSVTEIWEGAFSGCYVLANVYYKGTQKQWESINLDSDDNWYLIDYATIHFMGDESDSGDVENPAIGYKLKKLDGNYYNYTYTLEDSYFEGSSSRYNHDLCVASLCFAMQAGTPDDYRNSKAYNAEDMLYYHNFDEWKSFGYESDPTFNSIACVVGLKNTVINDENATIIAVAIRGEGYRAEWGGNANVGTDTHHAGFEIAANKVLSYVDSFMEGKNIYENVVYWVTGYSRAAATANLAASKLNNGASGYSNISATNPSKSKVFTYTFATPKNTTDKNAASSAYSNIFNIINPIDPVPTVAPESWGFTRYGVDYYLPAQEYTPGYNDKKNGIYCKMQSNYHSITGLDYAENFTFYQLGYDSKGDTLGFVPNKSMGQMTYINRLVEILADDSLKSRDNYVNNYQGSASKLIAIAMGGWESDGSGSKKLIESIANIFLDNWLYILFNWGKMTDDVRNLVASAIASFTAIDLDEAYALTGHLDELISGILKHPNYLYTTADFALKSSPDGKQPMIFYPHVNEIYLSWLTLVGQNGVTADDILTKAKNYRELKINCPVDVNVYDSEGNLVASIIDNEPVYIEENSLSCYVDENGQKCVALPNGEQYRVEMTATDSGEVNCSIHEFGADGVTVERVVNYTEMQVEKEDNLICTAEKLDTTDKCKYTVINQNGESVIAADDVLGSDIEEFTVMVSSNKDGVAVIGGGVFKKGEFAQVTAVSEDIYNFWGWYSNGKLVSKMNQFRFSVNSDVELVAIYTIKTAVSIVSPSITTVSYGDSIILHADVVGTLPEGATIQWFADNGNFEKVASNDGSACKITPKSSGDTTFTIKVVSADGEVLAEDTQVMTSKAGFFDKIIAFFKKIFGLTKTISQAIKFIY